jgi:hypothetical protein
MERNCPFCSRVARAVYVGLPDGTPLWIEAGRFKESRQGVLRRVLGWRRVARAFPFELAYTAHRCSFV